MSTDDASVVAPTSDRNARPELPPTKPTASDPFADLSQFRLSQDFSTKLGVKKAWLTIPVKKPAKEWWVQTHPDAAYRIETAVLELKEDRETYLVAPALWPALSTESTFSPRALFTAINTQGVVFIWPVRLPGADGKLDDWSRSALEAATMSQGRWCRVQSNMSLGAYELTTSELDKAPVWPEMLFEDLLRIAFKGKFIDSLEHPVLKKLRGEM